MAEMNCEIKTEQNILTSPGPGEKGKGAHLKACPTSKPNTHQLYGFPLLSGVVLSSHGTQALCLQHPGQLAPISLDASSSPSLDFLQIC